MDTSLNFVVNFASMYNSCVMTVIHKSNSVILKTTFVTFFLMTELETQIFYVVVVFFFLHPDITSDFFFSPSRTQLEQTVTKKKPSSAIDSTQIH